AEDGIRDRNVTGVQTCALPISCLGGLVRDPVDLLAQAEALGELRPGDGRECAHGGADRVDLRGVLPGRGALLASGGGRGRRVLAHHHQLFSWRTVDVRSLIPYSPVSSDCQTFPATSRVGW